MASIIKFSGYAIRESDKEVAEMNFKNQMKVVFKNLQHFHVESAAVPKEDQTISYDNCDLAECEKYFKATPTGDRSREVYKGQCY